MSDPSDPPARDEPPPAPRGRAAASTADAGPGPGVASTGEARPESGVESESEAESGSGSGSADPLDGAVDVAMAGLSQAFAHALAIAFEDAVQSQRRRAALADAALARAIEGLEDAPPESFRERVAEVTMGLDQLARQEPAAMAAYAEMAEIYRKALEALAAARPDARRRR